MNALIHHWRIFRPGFRRTAWLIVCSLLVSDVVLARPVQHADVHMVESPFVISQGGAAQIVPGSTVSLQSAVEKAIEARPGRVIRAVTVVLSGRRIHEIRILLDEGGRVVTVRIDAQSGETL